MTNKEYKNKTDFSSEKKIESINDTELNKLLNESCKLREDFVKLAKEHKINARIILFSIFIVLCLGLGTFIYADQIVLITTYKLKNELDTSYKKSQSTKDSIKTRNKIDSTYMIKK